MDNTLLNISMVLAGAAIAAGAITVLFCGYIIYSWWRKDN